MIPTFWDRADSVGARAIRRFNRAPLSVTDEQTSEGRRVERILVSTAIGREGRAWPMPDDTDIPILPVTESLFFLTTFTRYILPILISNRWNHATSSNDILRSCHPPLDKPWDSGQNADVDCLVSRFHPLSPLDEAKLVPLSLGKCNRSSRPNRLLAYSAIAADSILSWVLV